jgi:Bacteriocin-protection, YdeI or OmpD-Associated
MRQHVVVERARFSAVVQRRHPRMPRYVLDLPQSLCRRADADTGDSVEIVLVPVSDDPPDELVAAVTADPSARRSWERLSPSQRRAIVNDVLDAVRADTRQRRVERWARHLACRS